MIPLWIQKRYIFLLLILLGVAFALNFHIIRIDDGFEIINKEKFTFTDTYVDVRNWALVDYFSHSPRIRNYLFFEKPYNRLLDLIRKKREELEQIQKPQEFPDKKETLKETAKSTEKAIYDWIRQIFK